MRLRRFGAIAGSPMQDERADMSLSCMQKRSSQRGSHLEHDLIDQASNTWPRLRRA
jgi:hypothetical protein